MAWTVAHSGSDLNMIVFSLCACLGALNFGYAIGYSAPAIPSLVSQGVLQDDNVGWFGSLVTVGALLGGPISGWCIDQLGRKRTILLSSLPFLLGYVPMIVSQSVTYLFMGRLLTGWGSGMVMVCAPMYIAEIASKSRRGILGSCVQLFIVIGISVAFVVGLGQDWKKLSYVGLLPAVLSSMAACILPESPRWLLTQNRKREALQALFSVRDPSANVEGELGDMEEGIKCLPTMSWSELYLRDELRRPLLLSLTIMICQQLSGISAVMFYTVDIFTIQLGDQAYSATAFMGFVKLVMTVVACALVDHVGRKTLVMVGGTVMALSLFLFGLNKRLVIQGFPMALNSTISVILLIGAIVGFAVGWGPVPMLFMSEVFPAQCRGKAGSVAIFFHWLTAFFVTKEFSTMQATLGQDGVFYLFALCSAAGVWFVYKCAPETKGKSLEDIQQYFRTPRSAKF